MAYTHGYDDPDDELMDDEEMRLEQIQRRLCQLKLAMGRNTVRLDEIRAMMARSPIDAIHAAVRRLATTGVCAVSEPSGRAAVRRDATAA